MRKVLLSAVGNRDPYPSPPGGGVGQGGALGPPEDGAILAVVRALRPALAVLVATAETEKNAQETVGEIGDRFPDIDARALRLDLKDPTDYPRIIAEFRRILGELREELGGEEGERSAGVEYHVAVSSGTPQMQAAWLYLVNGNVLRAQVWQAREAKYVLPGEDRVRRVSVEWILEEQRLKGARDLFLGWDFNGAARELEAVAEQSYSQARREAAGAVARLFRAYAAWDAFRHQEAGEGLGGFVDWARPQPRWAGAAALVAEQAALLAQIVALGDREGPANLVDLYHNAERRLRQGLYTDCMARCRRLVEGLMMYLAYERCSGVKLWDSVDSLAEDVRRDLGGKDKGFAGLYDMLRLLKARAVIPQEEEAAWRELVDLSRTRNATIDAHGMRGAAEDEAGAYLTQTGQRLTKELGAADLSAHAFSAASLKRLCDKLWEGW